MKLLSHFLKINRLLSYNITNGMCAPFSYGNIYIYIERIRIWYAIWTRSLWHTYTSYNLCTSKFKKNRFL